MSPGNLIRPNGKHDDQVDSACAGARLVEASRPLTGGLYQYYNKLAQAPLTGRPESLSAMAKRLGLLRW
jgi:hypothetical protein